MIRFGLGWNVTVGSVPVVEVMSGLTAAVIASTVLKAAGSSVYLAWLYYRPVY